MQPEEEVEQLGVHVGCVITYPDEFMILNNDKLLSCYRQSYGRIHDCRSCSFLARKQEEIAFGLYITDSCQEEIGLRHRNDYQYHKTQRCDCDRCLSRYHNAHDRKEDRR